MPKLANSKALSENNDPDWRRMFAQLQGGAEGASQRYATEATTRKIRTRSEVTLPLPALQLPGPDRQDDSQAEKDKKANNT